MLIIVPLNPCNGVPAVPAILQRFQVQLITKNSKTKVRLECKLRLGSCSCIALDCCSGRNSTSPVLGVVPPA